MTSQRGEELMWDFYLGELIGQPGARIRSLIRFARLDPAPDHFKIRGGDICTQTLLQELRKKHIPAFYSLSA